MSGTFFRNIRLKYKIQLLIISCILLISMVAFISMFLLSKAYEKVLYHSVSSNLSYSAAEISECLKQADTLADMILSDAAIQEQLPQLLDAQSRAQKQYFQNTLYDALANYLFNTSGNYISYLSIMLEDTSITTYSPAERALPQDIKKDLEKTAQKGEGAALWVTKYSPDYGLFLVKELREAKELSLRPLGTLIICVDTEALVSSSRLFHSNYKDAACILSDGSSQIYYTRGLEESSIRYLQEHLKKGYGIFTVNKNTLFAVQGSIPEFGWSYICMISYASISKTISVTNKFCLLAMAVTLFFTVFSSARILEALTRHFQWLIYKMNRFGEGCYTSVEEDSYYHERKDEIGQLHTNFDAMVRKINTLIEENYSNELLKKEAQLKALESQMDPHFLYNTLDSINWRAKAIDAEDICSITTALGNLLRISLSPQSQPFTLRQEMDLIENYMTIQKLRFPRRLDFTVEIAPYFQTLPISKFIIQPLLENAVRYGLEEISETCHISLNAFARDNDIVIQVVNSGSVFEENLLEKLLCGELKPHGFGIGLLNIHKRLLLAYGAAYGLKLYNIEKEDGEEYACAQVCIPAPCPGKENSHAETADC